MPPADRVRFGEVVARGVLVRQREMPGNVLYRSFLLDALRHGRRFYLT